jgi:hypothetical protein
MNTFWNRILRAIKLETQLFEEVEADKDALPQALGVVLMSSLAAGIASISKGTGISLLSSVFGFLFSWFLFSFLIFLIGTKWLSESQTKSDYVELLRTIGFASAPGLITIAGIIPIFYSPAFVVAYIWMLVATVIAVRQALDFKSTGRAIVVCLIGWIVFVLLNWLIRIIIF